MDQLPPQHSTSSDSAALVFLIVTGLPWTSPITCSGTISSLLFLDLSSTPSLSVSSHCCVRVCCCCSASSHHHYKIVVTAIPSSLPLLLLPCSCHVVAGEEFLLLPFFFSIITSVFTLFLTAPPALHRLALLLSRCRVVAVSSTSSTVSQLQIQKASSSCSTFQVG